MSSDNTVSLIVALKGTKDIEKEGRIIRFGHGANLDTIRGLAAERLGIAAGYGYIQLLDTKGKLLGGIDDIKSQQVVYVDLRTQIKDVIPGPVSLPFVGSLYEMLPNL